MGEHFGSIIIVLILAHTDSTVSTSPEVVDTRIKKMA